MTAGGPQRRRPAPGHGRLRRSTPTGAHHRRLLGRSAAPSTGRGRSPTASTSSRRPARSATCGSRPVATGTYAGAQRRLRVRRSRSSTRDVYKWLEAVGWELGRGDGPGPAADGRRGDRRSSPPRSVPTATSTATSRCRRRHAVQRPAVGPRAVLHRPPHPGRRRLAPRARRRPAARRRGARGRRASTRSSGPAGATASTAIPRSRWRWWSCAAITGERALPGPRRAASSSCAGTGCWARAGSAPRTGRTASRSASAPSVAGHAVRQLYLDCGRRRRRGRDRRPGAARRGHPALGRHGRDADLPDRRRSAAATGTRRSATRSSCRPTAPTRRRAPRSRA